MSRSQSWKNLGPEGEKEVDLRRASSQPLYSPQTTASESNFSASNASLKSSMEDMRRRIVHLNKELEQERQHSKNLKRDKALEIRQVRDEEQKKASAMQADLRSKLHKEKMNELTSLKEQLHKEKEKEIMQLIRQKDEVLRSAQQAWAKEKDDLKSKVRNELRSEAREDTKREFEKERGRLEQEIVDLDRQKRELEETLKLVQGADKRKIDDIRRIHHEHEAELEKFKRNSWQESRQQMAEIRQLLNIIEQLEKKLGLEAGHSMRLRLEKDSLHDMLKKSSTFDAWDRMMSSGKSDSGQATPTGTLDSKGGSQELRMLQRKNVELSSLVRKLDEKNQQLATRNAELLAELEKLEKDSRDKNRKLERKNGDLSQTNKRLESRNKMLLDEVNSLKKSLTGRKENSVKPRGKASKEQDDVGNMKAQIREQTRTIADLKQSLMEKDRRIELLRGRKKNSKRQPASLTSLSAEFLPVTDDDVMSVHSDFSEASEMSSSDDVDSKRIKKLAKELLALERAYALLQAHVGSAVDAERDEMEKQQLQSDLLEGQARIHELERMMNDSGQGTGSEDISQLQADNKDLYQKLILAEKARDEAQGELAKYTEDMRELQDQRDLLEFELEEMSQLSTAGSEDWDSRRSRSNDFEISPSPRMMDNDSAALSLEEIKACLEELETEKENVLSPVQQSALKQARAMLESMAEKINHMEITESALRDKVRDLDLGYNSESLKSEFDESRSLSVFTCDQETLTDLQWSELDEIESYRDQRLEATDNLKHAHLRVPTEDTCCMTDLILEDLVSMENIYRKYLNGFPERLEGNGGHLDLVKDHKECMTDLVWRDLVELEETYRNILEELSPDDFTFGKGKGEVEKVDSETMTELDCEELEELESNYQRYREETPLIKSRDDRETITEIAWEELVQRANNDIYLSLSNEFKQKAKEMESRKSEIGIMTELALSELAEMESKYFECIEDAREPESRLDSEKEEVMISSVDIVETLPEIVLDTFPEDFTYTKDQCEMTELKWDDIVNLEEKSYSYEQLESKLAMLAVDKDEKSSCTEMSFTELAWNDMVNLQEKCSGYERHIKDLEKKIALLEVEKEEKGSCTDISLQDLVNAKFNVEMKEVETMTDSPEILDNEGLPQIVLETYPGTTETKDECDMTEGVWEEVVDLKNTYRDYRHNLEEMKHKLAQFEVEKDDKESITDIAMQDIADLESLYKDHLHEVDSDSNSLLSHVEKESKECMTELTFVELSELEDFYIENAGRVMESAPVVEKWEQESMTDVTLDDMQYLEEVEELYRQKADNDGDVEKDEKSTGTDLTILDVNHLQEVEDVYLRSNVEKEEITETTDKGIATDLTIPDLELLEETGILHQSCPVQGFDALEKEDRCVATELTVEDLKYWEEVEAAHEECLLDREDEKMGVGVESEEKQDVEMMTEFTMMDLQYLEEVDAAHEECLQDREEELERGRNVVEKLTVEIMTDLTVSDLKYLEDVEAAHEECIVHKQDELEAQSVGKQDAEAMTEFTASDLRYLEDVEAAHEECIADKQQELETSLSTVEKQNAEMMTDLTVSDLQYLEDVEAAHEECIADKQEELETRGVEVEKENVEVMTDLTVSDLQYLEEVEAAHEECVADKQEELETSPTSVDRQDAEMMTDLTVLDLQHIEEELEAGGNGVDIEIMTDLTMSDLKYLEDVEAAHEECIADKQEELEARVFGLERESVEVMTDLTVSDLQYWQDVEAAHEECIADKQEELETSAKRVDKQNAEMMTDLTASDLQNLEDKQDELEALCVEKQNAVVMTDLTVTDLQYLEDVESAHEECIADKQEELDARNVEKQSVEIMTYLTASDLTYVEEVEAAHEECLVDKQDELDTNTAEKQNAAIMTELTVSDLQYLEYVEAAHEECLQDKEEQSENKASQEDKLSVGTMTDMNAHDLKSLESAATEHEKGVTPKRRRWSRSSSITDHSGNTHSKNTMTEVTSNILEYYEDIEVLYKEKMVEFDDYRREHSAEKEEKDVMTDMTIEDLTCLEEAASSHLEKEIEDKEIMTELASDDFEYLMELESLYKDNQLAQESKDLAEKSDVETMTELTVSYIEYVEGEFERLKHEQSQESDSSWVVIDPDKDVRDVMTELTQSELQHLEEVEFLDKDSVAGTVEAVSKEDAEAMTELTTADLEYFEEAENLLKKISGDGGDLSGMLAPKDDKEVITDLTSADIDYLQVLGDVYGNGNSELPGDGGIEKDDKGTETELTIADIRDLEDQLESTTEMRTTPSFKEFVHEDFQAETLVDLQSELDYLPVLDEPEFILDEDEEGEDIQRQDVGVMTELTLTDLEYLEETEKHPSDSIMEATPEHVETGVQCELEGLGSLLQELSREAEENGEDVPAWFVSALKMTQPNGGFNPIHLVVRQTDEVDATPTDEHPDVESSPVRVLEETQLSNAPGDLIHLPEDFLESSGALSNGETDAESLPSDEPDAFSKDIGVQCDLVDVLAMLAEYQGNANDEDMAWFVSAMNMAREDTGFDPVQVHLRNRIDSGPVQDDVVDQHSSSLTLELSRPAPGDSTFTVHFSPDGQVTEEEQSEFPEADTDTLFTCPDGSDNVFNRTDESVNLPNDTEERDVLTDMPRDSSAVNRFDRFLKERKDSELLNLMALRREMDDGGIEGAEYIKSLKELEEENEMLRKQVETAKGVEDPKEENRLLKEKLKALEESDNTEELENENALLKKKVESMKDLEDENQLLKEEVVILRQSTAVEDIEEENTLLKDKIKMLEELATSEQDIKKIEEENDELREKVKVLEELAISEQDIKKIEEENDELREKVKTLEELAISEQKIREEENDELREKVKTLEEIAEVSELDMKNTEQEIEELKEKLKTLEESSNAEELGKENDYLKQQVAMLAAEHQRVKELKEENDIVREKIQDLEASANAVIDENAQLKKQIEVMEENERVRELENENEMLKEKVEVLEESSRNVEDLVSENALLKEQIEIMEETANVEDLVTENALLKEQIEIMEETGRVKELEDENGMLKEKVNILQESSAEEQLEHEQLIERIQDLEGSTARVVEKLEEENSMLKENIQLLEESTTNMKELENENALLREKIESLFSSSNIQELKEENAALKEKIQSLEESAQSKDSLSKEDFELLQQKIEQLIEAEKKIGALNQSNTALKERLDLLQKEKENTRDNSSEMDTTEQLGKELAKLKKENKELYEELMELRRQIQGREIAQRLNEATQTEHAQFPQDLTSFSRDVISPVSGSVEETITPQVRSTVATEIRYLEDRRLELELSPRVPYIAVRGSVYEGKDDLMDYSGIASDSGVKNPMPSHHDNTRDSDELISEPELMSSRRNLDSYMDDIDQRIQDLRHLDHADRPRTDNSDLVVFDSDDDDGDLPPLPESSPPPLPSSPPPDFPDSPAVLDQGLEVLLRSESSPPRDAATLRATSRQRFRSDSKPSSGPSLPSSRVESPITVEEPTLVMESEPSELGGIYPNEELAPSSVLNSTGFGSTKPADSTAKVPPQVLPKPKKILLQKRQPGSLSQPLVSYVDSNVPPPVTSQWSRDEEDGVVPPRGIVLNRATSINRGEIDALNEKIGFLEKQLKSKENLIRTMKTDATELETRSLLERKDREMKILDEDLAFLKQENQKKERELLTKIGEMNKKNYEIEKWKSEANNSERQRQRMEAAYMNLQNQLKNLKGAELKLAELQTKYNGMEKQNFELSEKVKKLERTEREFQKLEHNIQLLQAQVQEMDIVEQDRNTLMEKIKTVENQRDDLLRKGRIVESERNDFLRSNKLMEMQRDDLENRCAVLQKTNTTLNSRLAELEQDLKVAQTKMHDCQHERNFLQVQLDKMEKERNEMQTRLAITTQERNSLENQVAELQDLNRDHVKLEDGFHSLRIKLAESTRQKDDAEMQIPTLKAKISLLKRACKEKDELVDKLSEEIRELRHSIATSALDDMSKIRSYGYSPENFVKLSAQREQERKIAKRESEDLVEERLQSRLEKQSPSRSVKTFEPSPPGTKKAKRFVALFDYDPHKSPACEHPELELKLKEGDLLTVFGDMDINGYFEADVNGVRGLVPSLYVEEVEDDNDSELAHEEHLARSRRHPLEDVPPVSGPLKDVPSHKGNELQLFRDDKSSGHCTPSSGASSAGSEARQCMVALHDYDPFHSGAFGRPPQDQLSLKKGDIMTAYGDMDMNGFYRVDMNGQTGFVPVHLVQEVSSSSFPQPTSNRAPEQILGMLDNIQARGQPTASSTHMFSPPRVVTNGYPTPTHGLENVTPPSHVHLPGHPSSGTNHVRLPGDLSTPTNHVRLPGDLSTPTSHVPLLGDVRTPSSHVRPAGGLNSSLPDVGLTRFKPSPEVAMLGPLNNTLVTPVNSTQSAPLDSQKPVKASLQSPASKQIVPVVSNKLRSRKARPSAPSGFRIIRPVNHDAMLVGWTLPEMDEFGRSNGLTVKGYKIYANSDVKLEVRSPYMAKALVEDLELRFPIKFSIKTVAENGTSSETVSATFNDTIKGSLLDSFGESFEDSGDEQRYRTFVALYDYDPFKSSPNPNPATELGFKEGDILRVFDTLRKDGFYVGKLKNKKGLIPSNFVEEVAVASPRRLAAAKKRQAALPSPTRPFLEGSSGSNGGDASPALATKKSTQLRKKMMVALYDYNPEVQSPQDNPDSELSFKKGQILTVVGEMRADGFYHAEVNGQLGLVPGSFLDEYTNGETDSGLDSGRRVSFEKGRTQHLLGELSRT